MSRHYVITISRQFGTGGRAIGKALGAALGVPVYDRELLEEAARTYCIPVSVMERNDETAPSRVLESFALSAPSLSMLTGAVDYSTIVTSDTTFAWQSAFFIRMPKAAFPHHAGQSQANGADIFCANRPSKNASTGVRRPSAPAFRGTARTISPCTSTNRP